jgi:hypothetical protein
MILAQVYNSTVTSPATLMQALHLAGSEAASSAPTFGVIESLILVGLGVVFLLYGFKYFKILVMVNAAAVGGCLGYYLGTVSQSQSIPILFAVAGALVFGALAWPLQRAAVALLGAVSGLIIGWVLWDAVINLTGNASLAQYQDAVALVGMTVLGMLTFISFNPVVMIFTSIQGASMIVLGMVSLLMSYNDLAPSLRTALERGCLPGIFVACLALVGFVLQHAKGKGTGKKAHAAAAKPAAG